MPELWGADVVVSSPKVPDSQRPIVVDLGGSGFGFCAGGIAHTVTQNDIEELLTPTFAPPMVSGT